MSASELTPLESAVLERIRAEHPALSGVGAIEFVSRENSGAGRFTELRCEKRSSVSKDVFGLSAVVEMDGVENGLGAVLFAEGNSLTLELHTFDGSWDGVERGWKIEAET